MSWSDTHDHQRTGPRLVQADVETDPVDPDVDGQSISASDGRENRSRSSCHWVVNRVMTDAGSLAAEAKNPPMPPRSHPCSFRA